MPFFILERILAPTSPDDVIAFYAILSTPETAPSAHHTIVFDVAKTNVGNGYNHFTGVFTAPRTGVYVFVWVIRMATAEHSTELVIDNDVFGATFLRAKGGDDGSVSGTVVAQVSTGQAVYVRIHSTYVGDGAIHTNTHGQPSFSGWLLH